MLPGFSLAARISSPRLRVGTRGMARHHVGRGGDQRDRGQILVVVERQVRQQARIDRVGIEHDQPGIAVGRRLRHRGAAGAAGGAGAVLDHDRHAQPLSQAGLRQPRHRIDRAAGRERNDDPDRARRPALRLRRRRRLRGDRRQRGGEHHGTSGQSRHRASLPHRCSAPGGRLPAQSDGHWLAKILAIRRGPPSGVRLDDDRIAEIDLHPERGFDVGKMRDQDRIGRSPRAPSPPSSS